MRTLKTIALLLTAAAVQGCATSAPSPFEAATEHIATLPAPPEGYKWVVNEDFCDEFEGTELNEDLWYKKSPFWTNGRAPATFKAEAVSVKDGYLQITNYALDTPEGNDGKPGDKYHYAGGAVASKSEEAFYGYYETSMKASETSMSSTFWLNVYGEHKKIEVDGKQVTVRDGQEIDIIETIGVISPEMIEKNPKNDKWHMQMNSNVHFWRRSNDIPSEDITGPRVDVVTNVIEPSINGFHTYGCWWVDANTVKLYYDGKYMYTIKPSTKYTDTPLDQKMYMHLVTETYDWAPGVSPEQLADPVKATTQYDWVRSYKLVKE